jgi:hypothetical protein
VHTWVHGWVADETDPNLGKKIIKKITLLIWPM